ncbi:beta-xylosidase [Streptomyces phaeochromogenes]|uniref:GH39 family glycosyl hydrolase n=1 Tax=Streptomyces phaeochromogenes TaxID=1923 RepID=UPI0033C314A4
MTSILTPRADAAAAGEPLHHFWSVCAGAGRAAEGLRASWQEQLRQVAEGCGFRYIRFHGLFHDDMFVYRLGGDGQAVLNFQYVDDLFDRILDAGVRPFVELGFSPGDLAREKGTIFWWGAHGSPPTDLVAWASLVSATVRHWVARYGIDEVRQWYFEVWNEPNLDPFFRGTRAEYYDLYAATAHALKAIDPDLRVGGPATSNFVPDARFDGDTEDKSGHATVTADNLDALEWRPVWLEHFLDHCSRERLPVDFVSCHPYPTDWALDDHGEGAHYTRGADATRRDLTTVRDIVGKSPFPDAGIHLTEWSSTPSSRDHTHDHPQAATFVVRANLESIGLVDSLAYWTFTDVFEEMGAGDTAFHGGFGLLNQQGIPKPTYHAYRFLHALGDELLVHEPGTVVTREAATGRITALTYHYPPEMPLAVPLSTPDRTVAERTLALGTPVPYTLRLTGLPARAAFTVEVLEPGSAAGGDTLAAWRERGAPDPLSREDIAALRRTAPRTETVRADAAGELTYERQLAPWSVVLVRQDDGGPTSAYDNPATP